VSGEVDFGYEKVMPSEKEQRVRGVFDSVADRYDLMNDLMSLGVHRLWKRFFVEQSGVRPGQSVLDLAGGTGDIAQRMARRVGSDGRVIIADINDSMLIEGRKRLIDEGVSGNVHYLQVNAEHLPFDDSEFHCVTIAFGLRNVTDKSKALAEMFRVLRFGGRVMILEFSHPTTTALKTVYDAYSFQVLPKLGQLVAGDADSYRYLAESIRMHPDQDTLLSMLEDTGFERCRYHNLTGGIVAVHSGYRL